MQSSSYKNLRINIVLLIISFFAGLFNSFFSLENVRAICYHGNKEPL